MGRGLRPETSTAQGTMSAAVMRAVGPPSVLQLETDFPQPLRSVPQLGSCSCTCSAVALQLLMAAWPDP
jgi:hypothetical protein